MAKLYPPYINGTLPAFYKNGELIVPFIMNKTVSWSEIKQFALKVKNIQNNEVICVLLSTEFDKDTQQVLFEFNSSKFKTGMFYKVQLAYIDKNNQYGYYSTVGVIKYTTQPEVAIEGLEASALHSDSRAYIGTYSQYNGDVTEKIYSYNFTIYDENGGVVETSGELLHNHENDDEIYESSDQYQVIKSLEENKIYTIVYTVTTANGIVQSSPKYRIIQQSTIAPEISANLIATMNEENGYVNLQLVGNKDEYGVETVGTGTFLICRASSEDNYGSWSEVDRFALFGEAPSSHNWKDFTVQHGFTYIYSLQQYNKEWQIYSNRMLSNKIVANFEHAFLYNGKQQLKIKYNPKVSSFKENLLETKTNTIGGKFPFFFRNGNVAYKEFPISGLVSYHSDEEQLFLTNEDLLLEDLSNLKREHTLKPNVSSMDYDYFNDMLDVNLSYKLQAEYKKREQLNSQENQIANKKDRTTLLTDYNIVAERIFKMKVLEFLNDGEPKLFRSPAEGNYIVRLTNASLSPDDKLNRMIHTFSTTAVEIDECNYSKLNEYKLISTNEPETKQLRWKTINIRELINSNIEQNNIMGDFISIGTENNIMSVQFLDMIPGDKIKIIYSNFKDDVRIIQIGTTGAYYVEFDKSPKEIQISSRSRQGQATISYYGTNLHHFDTYRKIKIDDIPIKQLIGSTNQKDIREFFGLEDIKHKITKYYFLNFTKHYKEKIDRYKFWIDGKEVDITETNEYQLIKPEHIPEIILGDGICLDISIQRREIEYDVETENSIIVELKNSYLAQYQKVQKIILSTTFNTIDEYEHTLQTEKLLLNTYYNRFIKELEKVLKENEVLA